MPPRDYGTPEHDGKGSPDTSYRRSCTGRAANTPESPQITKSVQAFFPDQPAGLVEPTRVERGKALNTRFVSISFS